MRARNRRGFVAIGFAIALIIPNGIVRTATAGQVTLQISDTDDDYKESQSGSSSRNDSTHDLWVNADLNQAYRFVDVPLDPEEIITSAILQVYSPSSGTTNLLAGVASGEAVGDAPAWQGVNSEITNAPKTTASVVIANIPAWTANTHNDLVDVTTIVQEIVDRGDWSSGNALKIFVNGTDTTFHRRSRTYDSNPSRGAKLIITTTERCDDRLIDLVVTDDVLTAVDTGWTGLGHNGAAATLESRLTGKLTACDNATPPCGTCDITGPERNRGNGEIDSQRCSENTRTKCTTNADCTGGVCQFYFSPHLSVHTQSPDFCAGSPITGSITGTVNLGTGALAVTVPMLQTRSLGLCPSCENDVAPNDGVRDGTCAGGPNDTLTCDANGQTNPHDGKMSLDCPPGPSVSLDATIEGSTDTETLTLVATSPTCRGSAPDLCLCDTCNNAAEEPCFTHADCPDNPPGTAGICGGLRCDSGGVVVPCTSALDPVCTLLGSCAAPGPQTRPNTCLNAVCVTSPTGDGICSAGPFDLTCSTAPFAPCLNDANCAAFLTCSNDPETVCVADSDCPASGTCVADSCTASARGCFTGNGTLGGTVTTTGSADTPVDDEWDATLSQPLECAGPSGVTVIDNAVGLPGVLRRQLPVHVRVRN